MLGRAGAFMQTPAGNVLLQGGLGAATAMLQGQQQDDSEQQPLAYWGRGARDQGGGLGPGEVSFDMQPNNSSWSTPSNSRALMLDPNDTGVG
jgi:hypothetical protein